MEPDCCVVIKENIEKVFEGTISIEEFIEIIQNCPNKCLPSTNKDT